MEAIGFHSRSTDGNSLAGQPPHRPAREQVSFDFVKIKIYIARLSLGGTAVAGPTVHHQEEEEKKERYRNES